MPQKEMQVGTEETNKTKTICFDATALIGDILPVYALTHLLEVRPFGEGDVVAHCLHGGKPSEGALELLHAVARAKLRNENISVVLVVEAGGGLDWWRFCCNCVEMWAGVGVLFDAVSAKGIDSKWQRTTRQVGISSLLIESVSACGLGVVDTDQEGRCLSWGCNLAQKGVANNRGIIALAKSRLPAMFHGLVDRAMLPREISVNHKPQMQEYDIGFLLKHRIVV